jgi:hypothetical protein
MGAWIGAFAVAVSAAIDRVSPAPSYSGRAAAPAMAKESLAPAGLVKPLCPPGCPPPTYRLTLPGMIRRIPASSTRLSARPPHDLVGVTSIPSSTGPPAERAPLRLVEVEMVAVGFIVVGREHGREQVASAVADIV